MDNSKHKFIINCSIYLWEYIGDLSQDVLEASYNEDEIRELWCNGLLDDEIKKVLSINQNYLDNYKREDCRYSDQLTALVNIHGGWASDYGPNTYPLTEKEKLIVNKFLNENEVFLITES